MCSQDWELWGMLEMLNTVLIDTQHSHSKTLIYILAVYLQWVNFVPYRLCLIKGVKQQQQKKMKM